MEAWEVATNKFLEKWKSKKEVIGAIVCGSYVTGNPSKHSDIDLQIILSDECDWRSRGNVFVDGFLIEYFINPPKQHIKYIESDFNERRKVNVHMFLTGKVLFDKTGELKKLIEISKKWNEKKFKKSDKIKKEINKYALWDMRDNLEEVYESDSNDFYYVYYNFLDNVFYNYGEFLGFENINSNKLSRFLSNEKDKKKYNVNEFSDKKFVKIFLDAQKLESKNEMMIKYQKLTEYVLEKMGGFNIDGWNFKCGVEK